MESTKLRLLLDFPFFGSLAMRMPLVADPSVNTFQVNGIDIKYNPAHVSTLTGSQKMFSYIHEIMHVVLGHFERQGGRDHDLWNIAADFAINQMIPEEHGVRRPHGILLDNTYNGMGAEEIYAMLADEFEGVPRAGGVDPESEDPGDGEVIGREFDGGGNVVSTIYNGGTISSASAGDHGENDGNATIHGDMMTDREAAYESLLERSRQFGEVVEPPPESDVTASGMRGAAAMVAQLMEADGEYIPEQIKELVYTITDTKLPWTEFLSKFLHESCIASYNWMRPNQRYSAVSDFILPSLRSNDAMTLAVVIDTSKSINGIKLGQFMTEFFALIASINYVSLMVLTCSKEVIEEETLYPGQKYEGGISGGGSTKFSPAFARLAEKQISPACLVYFTDLGSDDFGPQPQYPVMWVGDYTAEWEEAHRKRVPFGQVLSMRG